MNFLALLGWAPDGETTIMSRDELVERFSLERVGRSPATFDYAKLDWMNGVYLRALDGEAYAGTVLEYLRERGIDLRLSDVQSALRERLVRAGYETECGPVVANQPVAEVIAAWRASTKA